MGWVAEAVAAQEEYLKRVRSCCGELGAGHAFRRFGRPGRQRAVVRCVVCGVTQTREDFMTLQAGLGR